MTGGKSDPGPCKSYKSYSISRSAPCPQDADLWLSAVDAGDQNVYFIDGEELFGKDLRDCCTVDGCHPNDFGFYRMYARVLPVLKKALKKQAAR